jgi:K+-transporting ATPase ATPase A chain
MNVLDGLPEMLLFVAVLMILTPALGAYMKRVFDGSKTFLSPLALPLERAMIGALGERARTEMSWKTYLVSLIVFNFTGLVILYVLMVAQPLLPGNMPSIPPLLAFNTAVSFVTNTNWQAYAGETALGIPVQMLGICVQNFLSAATGMAVAAALMRGLTRVNSHTVGNYWSDMTRILVHILLPISMILAVIFVSQGSVQTFHPSRNITTIEGRQQTIPLGPVASQVAIKQLGSNGGGYFNANSAHPFENPTPLTNFLQTLSLILIASAFTSTLGRSVGSKRHGWVIWSCMMGLFLAALALSLASETGGNPFMHTAGMMEGKETRFGITGSVLWSSATTAASNGSVNAAMDSMSPLAGLAAMINMMIGEVAFGGVGSGLYGMIVFIVLTVFISGLLVGRTPEYCRKKIDIYEVRMAVTAVLAPNAAILVVAALAFAVPGAALSISNGGPHGFSQVLYAATSAAANNGSAFGGLNANTGFFDISLAIGMIVGRFGVIVPVMAIAGSLAAKGRVSISAGSFRTDTSIFAVLLLAVILIIGALTFFPALSLGPISEHFLMNNSIGW